MVNIFTEEISISCDAERIFDYVTDPNKWHEWYPSSQPASEKYEAQKIGAQFQIITVQQPIGILPLKITRTLNYTVTKSERGRIWEISACSSLIDSTTTYRFTKSNNTTLFTRDFRYRTKGWLKIAEPILLRKSIVAQAKEGLINLKEKIEAGNA